MTVHPPVAKKRHYPALSLTVIHAHERVTPVRREPIRWKLLTDLPSAVEKLEWYTQRWKIETYHKVLKSGVPGRVRQTPDGVPAHESVAVFCIIGWRVFWLTMANCVTPW